MLAFPKTTVPVAIKYLRSVLPDAHEILEHMESAGGWLGLPPKARGFVEFMQIGDYIHLYQGETRLAFAL